MVENRGKVAHYCITGYSFCTEIADHQRQESVVTDLSYSITTAAALDLLTSYNSIKRKYRRTVSRLYMARARRRTLLILGWLLERRRLFLITGAVPAFVAGTSNARPNHTLCPIYTPFYSPSLQLPTCSSRFTMSQPPSTSIPPSNFQSIFNAALKAYEKKTKKDLLAHPLAAQLQACKSPGDILAVLQDKVNEFDQSRSADERLSQWLNPTINVLYSFSATLGAGVGLVSVVKSTCPLTHSSPISQVFSPASVIFSGVGVLLSVSIVFGPCLEAILTIKYISGG